MPRVDNCEHETGENKICFVKINSTKKILILGDVWKKLQVVHGAIPIAIMVANIRQSISFPSLATLTFGLVKYAFITLASIVFLVEF